MGSIFKTPKPPAESQESKDAKAAERKRLADEQLALDAKAADLTRKRRSNMIGSGSLQSDDMAGYTGYRRNMGTKV